MFDDSEQIKMKLIERSADLDVARNRWVFAFIASALMFFVVLGLYYFPIAEISTQRNDTFAVSKDGYEQSGSIQAVAIPSLYEIYFELKLNKQFSGDHARLYVYIFKDSIPNISQDIAGGDPQAFHDYLKSHALRNASLTSGRPEIEWKLAFRDADTNTFHLMFYNPDDPDDPYDNLDVVFDMKSYYEPMLPLLPIFFIFAFIIILPIAIIRIYVLSQKKKELRVLLTLDLANLSDEDKIRLGIPVSPKPQGAVVQPERQQATYAAPTPSSQAPVPMVPGTKPSTRAYQPPAQKPKDGYMTVDDL